MRSIIFRMMLLYLLHRERMVEQKGHDFLIEAAEEIVKTMPTIRFLFLGDGEREALYKDMIAERNLSKYFVFCGMLDEITNHLMAADIMIHPSRVEPFGIAVLEGMRAGLPVATSNVGGIPEVVENGKNAELFEVGNIKQIAEVVVRMISDKSILKQMGEESRKRFESVFSLEKMSTKLETVYSAVSSVNV